MQCEELLAHLDAAVDVDAQLAILACAAPAADPEVRLL